LETIRGWPKVIYPGKTKSGIFTSKFLADIGGGNHWRLTGEFGGNQEPGEIQELRGNGEQFLVNGKCGAQRFGIWVAGNKKFFWGVYIPLWGRGF